MNLDRLDLFVWLLWLIEWVVRRAFAASFWEAAVQASLVSPDHTPPAPAGDPFASLLLGLAICCGLLAAGMIILMILLWRWGDR